MTLEERRKLLVGLLGDADSGVRAAAAGSLEQLESYQDLAQIVAALTAEKRATRVKAIFAMARINSAEVFPHLIELLKDVDADIRAAAVQVLGVKAHPKSLTSLVRHLKDPAPAVRVHTAEALGHFQDPRLVPYLAAMLGDADEQLVISAARSLGRLGTAEAAAPLAKLLHDARAPVRQAAAQALGVVPL